MSQTAPMDAAGIKAAYQRAVILQNAGRIGEAARIYTDILKQRDLAEPAFQLGRIARQAGRPDEAATWLRRALKLKPRQAEIWAELIGVLEGGERVRAVKEARRLGVVLSNKIVGGLTRAAEHVRAGRLVHARKTYRAAIRDGADPGMILCEWGNELHEAGHAARAVEVFDEALAAAPGHVRARLGRATALQTLGRLDDSIADLRRVVADAPYNGAAWTALMRSHKQPRGAPDVARLERCLAEGVSDPEAVRAMSFALAKALEDQKRYREAFAHLERANRMTRAKYPWDFPADRARLAQLIAAWEPLAGGHDGAAPIFVTGLPRSGTTLVETILASHPAVAAGGEMAALHPILNDPLTAWIDKRTPFDLADAGRRYAREARRQAKVEDPETRVTDKSISTYALLGHALNVLPRARFVVLARDRRDVGLSIYKNRFRDGTHRYATDLVDVARQIRMFDAAIAAWQARIPQAIHVVDYEALTADPEPHVRALLAFCGLSWDPACLTPEKTERDVRTLSSVQVRQPIYRSSVAAWTRFEEDLAPMIEALDTLHIDLE